MVGLWPSVCDHKYTLHWNKMKILLWFWYKNNNILKFWHSSISEIFDFIIVLTSYLWNLCSKPFIVQGFIYYSKMCIFMKKSNDINKILMVYTFQPSYKAPSLWYRLIRFEFKMAACSREISFLWPRKGLTKGLYFSLCEPKDCTSIFLFAYLLSVE